jgi:hypothetical protein
MFQNQRGFDLRVADPAQAGSRGDSFVQFEYWVSRVTGYGALLAGIVLGGVLLLS